MRSIPLLVAASLFASSVATTHAISAAPPASELPPSPKPLADTVPLVLTSDDIEVSYRVFPDDRSGTLVASCPTSCTIQVPPGRYRIEVGETATTRSGRRTIEVFGPTRAWFEPRTLADKEGGLIMAVAGTVMVVGGAVGLTASILGNTHCTSSTFNASGTCETDWTAGATISVLVLIGGCVLSPIGWVQFARSSPKAQVTPLDSSSPPVSFTILPLERRMSAGGASLTGGVLLGTMVF